MAYGVLARYYDRLMAHVDYEAMADYLLGFVGERRRALDLACGTGRFTEILCRRGYDTVSADASSAMLTEAMSRNCGALFLHQSAVKLDLYGTVELVFCTMDSMNYLTEPTALRRAIERVRLFLEPGGLFIFDVHHPNALRARDGRSYSSECEGAFCVWDCRMDGDICRQRVTLFCETEARRWERHTEWHDERAYEAGELLGILDAAGFAQTELYGMYTRRAPEPGDERLLFVAR